MLTCLQSAQSAQLKVLLRYDDYSSGSRVQTEKALFDAARQLGAGVLVGVIPFSQPDDPAQAPQEPKLPTALAKEKIDLLKEYSAQNVIEIGVHGFSHINNAAAERPSEFAGLPFERQRRMLRTAKSSLEEETGTKIRAFIPPYNTYDEQTLRALDDAGYRLLSAGLDGPTLREGRLTYLPGGPYPQMLKGVVLSALGRGHQDALVVSTMHPYDIVGSAGGIPDFRHEAAQISIEALVNMLRELKQLKEVRFVSIEEIFAEDLSAGRVEANLRLNTSLVTRHRLIPDPLHAYPLAGLYYSTQSADRLYRLQVISFVLLYGTLLGLVTLLSRAALGRFSPRWRNMRSAALAVATIGIAAVIATSHFRGFYLSAAAIFTCCLGLFAGSALPRRSEDQTT